MMGFKFYLPTENNLTIITTVRTTTYLIILVIICLTLFPDFAYVANVFVKNMKKTTTLISFISDLYNIVYQMLTLDMTLAVYFKDLSD